MTTGMATTVVTPEDGAQLAAALHAAARARQATVISGGGTKLSWGRPPASVDLLVRTSKLTQVTHRHDDLTVTVGAGASLIAVNQALARHRQWLPFDSAFADATVGGLVATNDAGPLRHRFGTPRDRVLGVTLALTDGRVVKAGGTVVKNVAGYDLSRLVSGSFGTLAAIETVTFKVEPQPAASGTLVVPCDDRDVAHAIARALLDSTLELTALDIRASLPPAGDAPCTLLVRIASSPVSTTAQLAAATALANGRATLVTDDDEAALWRDQVDAPWVDAGEAGEPRAVVTRLSWKPADLVHVLGLLADVQRESGVRLRFTGRVAIGAGLLRIDGEAAAQVAAVERLRASTLVAHVVLLRAQPSVTSRVDVWGPMGDTVRVLSAVKRALDPEGILNAGRGPI